MGQREARCWIYLRISLPADSDNNNSKALKRETEPNSTLNWLFPKCHMELCNLCFISKKTTAIYPENNPLPFIGLIFRNIKRIFWNSLTHSNSIICFGWFITDSLRVLFSRTPCHFEPSPLLLFRLNSYLQAVITHSGYRVRQSWNSQMSLWNTICSFQMLERTRVKLPSLQGCCVIHCAKDICEIGCCISVALNW